MKGLAFAVAGSIVVVVVASWAFVVAAVEVVVVVVVGIEEDKGKVAGRPWVTREAT